VGGGRRLAAVPAAVAGGSPRAIIDAANDEHEGEHQERAMNKEIVSTSAAPAAIGPYSQAVKTGLVVFSSGQIGLDPASGELVSGDFEPQVRQAFRNLEAVAHASGATLANAVKFTLFLTDLAQFATVNRIMGEVVPQPYPARSTVGVASLPKGALFEVEAIFVL
jgi:reactive intermediate/imine deaminase